MPDEQRELSVGGDSSTKAYMKVGGTDAMDSAIIRVSSRWPVYLRDEAACLTLLGKTVFAEGVKSGLLSFCSAQTAEAGPEEARWAWTCFRMVL